MILLNIEVKLIFFKPLCAGRCPSGLLLSSLLSSLGSPGPVSRALPSGPAGPPPSPASTSSSTSYHPSEFLTISHININSITSTGRLDELDIFTSMNAVDIVCLTETKLDSLVHPSLYTLDHYHNPLTNHRDRHGGGVAIYVKDTIAVKRLPHLEQPNIEWIWCLVKTGNSTLVISNVYLPPNLSSSQHADFLEKLNESVAQSQALNPDCIVILGDMNAGNNYLCPQFTNHSPLNPFELKLQDEIAGLNMQQIITVPTRYSNNNTANLRDLIVISNPSVVKESGVLPPFSKIDHIPTFVTLEIVPPRDRHSTNAYGTTDEWTQTN